MFASASGQLASFSAAPGYCGSFLNPAATMSEGQQIILSEMQSSSNARDSEPALPFISVAVAPLQSHRWNATIFPRLPGYHHRISLQFYQDIPFGFSACAQDLKSILHGLCHATSHLSQLRLDSTCKLEPTDYTLQLIDPYWTILPPLIGASYLSHPDAAPCGGRCRVAMALIVLWSIRLTHSYFRRSFASKGKCFI